MGSSSNRYAPRLPQQETKSSTKQLAPTDPILGLENLLKTGFAQKGLPSKPTHAPSAALFHVETHQPRTNQHRVGNKGLEQGPNSVSKNHISFRCKKRFFFFVRRPVPFGGSRCIETYSSYSSTTSRTRIPGGIDPRLAVYARSWDGHYTTSRRDRLQLQKTNPKTSLLSWIWQPFPFYYVEVACFQSMQSRRFEAWACHFSQKGHCSNLIFRAINTLAFWTPKKWSSPVALKACCLNKSQLWFTYVM